MDDEFRVDRRDAYIRLVLSDMGPYLVAEQLQKLQDSLYKRTQGFCITTACKELTVNLDTNVDIIKRFLITKKIQGLSDKSLKYYTSVLKSFLTYAPKSIQDITSADVYVYLAYLMSKSSKINADNYRRILNSFFNWCLEDDVIVKSPMSKVKKIKFPAHIRQPFTQEEIERMRQICGNNIRNRAIFEFLLSTACRVSEMVALNIKDVDLISGEAVVMGKGSKERRVYLNAVSKLYIKQYLATRNDDEPALFATENRPFKRLALGQIENIIRDIGEVVGTRAFPHKLRHTAATNAIRRGMSIEQVKQMLGHANINTTLIYAKVACDDVKYAHNKYC